MSAMKKILIAILVLSTPAPALAVEEEFCAMVIKVPDEPYVILRTEPGEQFEPRIKLVLNGFLYADTSQCSKWSPICTKNWTHVYSVHRMMVRPGIMCMDIQPGGFIRIISRVCHVIGIGDIQTQIRRKTWTRRDKDPASRSVS